jgi:hypothetical protein
MIISRIGPAQGLSQDENNPRGQFVPEFFRASQFVSVG